MSIPKLISQFWVLFKELLRGNTLEDLNNIGRSKYGVSRHEEVNMIRHDILIDQCNTLLLCYQFVQPMKVFGD
ncbi:MAG: hypothetical protein XD72_1721 [Methanothrix harundinacea]|uniref:Uncharacterized protein n=1 Tax=Methanothrix harundinacea TaxID=301375 RepID=A0A101FT88_9EURY|nr:MAG: hypothetical protein XD72_1721 [Methanothrix harundinacea]KUK96429.1 MAG: hypothetical protein XE07_1100 [Methanothrix harundinacea]